MPLIQSEIGNAHETVVRARFDQKDTKNRPQASAGFVRKRFRVQNDAKCGLKRSMVHRHYAGLQLAVTKRIGTGAPNKGFGFFRFFFLIFFVLRFG